MKAFLVLLMLVVLAGMLFVTISASLDRSVLTAGQELWPDPWFRATLADAYFGFLMVYLWICYRERSWTARGVWFVLLAALGNIAIAVYVLMQVGTLQPDEGVDGLFRRKSRP